MKIPLGSGVVANRDTSVGLQSSATNSAMNMVDAAASIADKWMDQRAESNAQEARNQYQRKVADLNAKYTSKQGKEALGSTQEYEKELADIHKEISGNLGKRSVSKLGDFGIRVGESGRQSIMYHEREQERKFNTANFNDGVNLSEEMVRQDAKNWRAAADNLSATVESGLKTGLWTEEEHAAKKTEIANRFRAEAGKAYYTQDKHAFMKEINEFGFGKPEVAAYKKRYQDDLLAEQREKKALFAEEAKLLYGKKDDMKVQAIVNNDTSHFFDSAKKLEQMGYKDWANDLREEGSLQNEVISFKSENKGKSLVEIRDAAMALKIPETLDGSSKEFKARAAIQKEVTQSLKLFDKDPAQFVSAQQVGGNMEEIASSRLSLQEQQGLFPSKGYKILTLAEKQNLKGGWEAGDISQRAEQIKGIRSSFGKHSSQVFSEMGVNNSLTLVPMLEDDKDVELLVAGVSENPQILDDSKKSDFSGAAKDSDFYNTLVKLQQKFPTNPDLPQKVADVEVAMTGIAARKVDPKAGRKFFDEKFETVEASDKLIYFPSSMDSDEIEESLDKRKQELVQQFKTGDEKKDNLSRWAIRDAVWVNTPNGFALADSRSGAYLPGSEVDMMNLDSLSRAASKPRKDSEKVTYTRR